MSGTHTGLPVELLIVLGNALFLWTSLVLIGLRLLGPDMLVAAVAYVAAGVLLRISSNRADWLAFLFLGVVLGIGYLVKAAMFPLAFAFLGTGLTVAGPLRREHCRES